MTQTARSFLDNRYDFSAAKSCKDVLAIFIDVAKSFPDMGSALFDKYVDYLKSINPRLTTEEVRDTAKSNVFVMMGACPYNTITLLHRTYKELRQK